jgi:hypothetical protein
MLLTILAIIGIVIGSFAVILFLIIGINILQNGIGGWNGKPLEEILGCPASKAMFDDVVKFKKARLMQLFYAASAPPVQSLAGEIDGMAPRVGVFYPFADFFLTMIYGQGSRWIGKSFKPETGAKCWGYNLFQPKNNDKLERKRKMDTYIAKSNIDGKDSFHLDYSQYNKDMAGLIRDEVRKINDELYIGMGYLMFPGGSLNPTPFILHGKFRKWVGPDKV